MTVPGPGKLELSFTPADGSAPTKMEVFEFDQGGGGEAELNLKGGAAFVDGSGIAVSLSHGHGDWQGCQMSAQKLSRTPIKTLLGENG